jgi:hypothetical protein
MNIALFASIDSIATRHCPRRTWSKDEATSSLGSGIGQLLGVSHADEVAGDETAQNTVVWHDVPLQVGYARIVVPKDNRRSLHFV